MRPVTFLLWALASTYLWIGCASEKRSEDDKTGAQPAGRDPATAIRPALSKRAIGTKVSKASRMMSIRALGTEVLDEGDHVDILVFIKDPMTGMEVTKTLLEDIPVALEGPKPDEIGVQVLPGEAELLALGQQSGTLQISLRNPDNTDKQNAPCRATIETLFTGQRTKALKMQRLQTIQLEAIRDEASGKEDAHDQKVRVSHRIHKRGRALVLPVMGAEMAANGDHVDILVTLENPKSKSPVAITAMTNLIVLSVEQGKICVLVLPQEAEILFLASQLGQLLLTLRNPGDLDEQSDHTWTNIETLLTGKRPILLKKRESTL
ncbi:MAG: hypothetical protein JXR96_06105 [Deltaproteobacteria bacterium]|nr:hypothetical protein [Deltaproteobacteria bacterium]